VPGLAVSASEPTKGISSLQGPHQVAQKLTSTTFPDNSLDFTTLPSSVASSKGTAMLPAGNRLILSETKGSPASVGPAAAMLTRESAIAITVCFIDAGMLRFLFRQDLRRR